MSPRAFLAQLCEVPCRAGAESNHTGSGSCSSWLSERPCRHVLCQGRGQRVHLLLAVCGSGGGALYDRPPPASAVAARFNSRPDDWSVVDDSPGSPPRSFPQRGGAFTRAESFMVLSFYLLLKMVGRVLFEFKASYFTLLDVICRIFVEWDLGTL